MGMLHYIRPGSKVKILSGSTPKWISNSRRAGYIASVVLSAPMWVRFRDFRQLRAEAEWLTVMCGELYVLDHIVPLNHPLVCGLTVPWNLRVIHWRANCSKGNDWSPDQLDMFDSPELTANSWASHFRRYVKGSSRTRPSTPSSSSPGRAGSGLGL